jgi:DNA-binding MarR family transcriptional regulator
MDLDTYETILFDVFLTNQKRAQLIEAALAETDLPAEDYPFYVIIGAEGPWTPTDLARRLMLPLTTVLFRVRRLERRGQAERKPNPDDGRSFTIRLTPAGQKLLRKARPRFRAAAEAVEAQLGAEQVAALRDSLANLRTTIDAELFDAPDGIRTRAAALKGL